MKTIDITHSLFSPEKAERIAAELKAGDPEWEYIVRHDPQKKELSYIEVFDETGNFVSRL